MLFDPPRAVSVLANSLAVAAIPATPCLTILAFRVWAKRLRKDLPSWRNALGLISMLATFVCWLGYVAFFLLLGFTRVQPGSMLWLVSGVVMLCLGISSAIALKSPSRPLILLSGLLMTLLFWASVNI